MWKSYGSCRTYAVYCNQDRHAWHFHKHLMSNHSSAMILRLSKISLISNPAESWSDLPATMAWTHACRCTSLFMAICWYVWVAGVAGGCHEWRRSPQRSRPWWVRRRPSSSVGLAAMRAAAVGALHPPTWDMFTFSTKPWRNKKRLWTINLLIFTLNLVQMFRIKLHMLCIELSMSKETINKMTLE